MIGKTISHFKILEKIGAGGMGEVYLAEDTALDRKVALKFLPPHYSSDSELIARFKREAKAAASLNHPNIITVHEVGEHEGQTFIAMEYVEGKSLRALIEEGELPLARVLDIGSQICEGLAKAHQADIVHRDIKPENIMIDEDGRVRILDFGLAKLRNVSKLTQTATTLGTLNYMSPEQLQGMEVDQRTDIWSVGVVLYEMITRKLPFQGEYEATFIYSVLNEEPQPMSEVDHQAPEQLERIVSKAISKNPEERFQNTTELLGDLRLLTEGWAKTRTKTVFSAWQRPKRHSKYLTFSAISLTLFLIVLAGYWFFNRDVASQQRITIAVVDFVNETGEPELNGLSGMLITALEQSRRLSVLTRSRMFDILKQLDKADVSQIDEVLGKAICQKANVRTMAIASIKKFGRVYTIDLKLLDTDLNEYLLTVGEKGEGKESIPDLIDSIAEKTRKGLKEAEAEIRSTTQKVAAITTPNLEAYQHFFKGEELVNKLRYREAKDEFRQAIALDSTFGLAYLALAYATDWDNGDEEIVSEYVQKAVRFVDRIPEKERYLVRTYAAVLKDGWEAGLNILKQMEKLYPEDKEMTFQIGVQYYFGDDNQRALQYFEKVLDMDPEHERALNLMTLAFLDIGNLDDAFEAAKKHEKVSSKNAQSNLVLIYYYFGDYLKAEECANQLLEFDSRILDVQPWPATTAMKNILSMSERFEDMFLIAKRLASRGTSYSPLAWASASSGRFEEGLHELYLLRNQTPKKYATITRAVSEMLIFMEDYDRAEAELKVLIDNAQSPQTKVVGYLVLSRLYFYLGHYRAALKMTDELLELARKLEDVAGEARMNIRKGLIGFWGWNDVEGAKREIERARRHSKKINSLYFWIDYFYLSLFAGKFNLAEEAIWTRFDTKVRVLTMRNNLDRRRYYPFPKAELLSARGECGKAAALVDSVYQFTTAFGRVAMLYHLAECQFEQGYLEEAEKRIRKFQTIYNAEFDYRAIYYPRSFYLLGKIYEGKGDTELAIENYEKLLNLWKDADQDLTVLIDTKARLANLRGSQNIQ